MVALNAVGAPPLRNPFVFTVQEPVLLLAVDAWARQGLLSREILTAQENNFKPACLLSSDTRGDRQNQTSARFPDKTKIDAVIFDMDGTLLNSLAAWDHAAMRYLKTRGIEMPEAMEEEILHMSLTEGAAYLQKKLNVPETPEELLAGTLGVVRQHYLNDVTPKAGVLALLHHLHAQGIKISVATASDKEIALRVFKKWGLDMYIDFVITCDEVGVGKLSPKIYDQALERLGTARGRTLVVEDALYALKTAKAAGFLTAGIADSYHAPAHEDEVRKTGDYFFTSFEDSLK